MSAVSVFEEHSEVAALWSGDLSATVICFDRHLDLKPLNPSLIGRLGEGDAVGLIRTLPLRGSGQGFGLDDFWSAAAVLGLRRLVWVPSWASYPGWHASALDATSLILHAPDQVPDAPVFNPCCVQVRLCGLTVDIVPWNLLSEHMVHVEGPVIVDIDLDWLADEHGVFEHSLADLADLVKLCDGPVQALTRSVRSGFLPSELRSLSADCATTLGLTTQEDSFLPRVPWKESLLNSLHQRAPIDSMYALERAATEDTRGYLTAFVGIAACSHDLVDAEKRYDKATSAGYQSSWLSYSIGAGHAATANKAVARDWFLRAADIDGYDTMAAHARLLAARCLDPQKDGDVMLDELSALARVLPYRRSLWESVEILAEIRHEDDIRAWAYSGARRLDLHIANH